MNAARSRSACVAIALLAVLVRLRFLDVPLSVDEGGYAAVARFWASGSHLYRDVWVDRPQGLLLLYRGAFDLFGPHAWAVRALATVWGAGLASVVALLVARVADRRTRARRRAARRAALGRPAHRGLRRQRRAARGAARPPRRCSCSRSGSTAGTTALLRQRRRARRVRAARQAVGLRRRRSDRASGSRSPAWRGWLPRRQALRALGLVATRRAIPIALSVAHGAATGLDRYWFAIADYRLSVESVATGLVRRSHAPALVGLRQLVAVHRPAARARAARHRRRRSARDAGRCSIAWGALLADRLRCSAGSSTRTTSSG